MSRVQDSARQATLLQQISQLPPQTQEILSLYAEGFSIQQLAREFSLPRYQMFKTLNDIPYQLRTDNGYTKAKFAMLPVQPEEMILMRILRDQGLSIKEIGKQLSRSVQAIKQSLEKPILDKVDEGTHNRTGPVATKFSRKAASQ